MKVIIHRYNSICEPDYIAAFQAIGLDVMEDRDEMTIKTISAQERMQKLGRLIFENRPLFVFTINFFPYIALLCEKLKVFYVAVSVDCPVAELYDESIRSPYNRVFLFDRQQYLSIHEENPDHIFHLPLSVNTERIDHTIGTPEINGPRDGYAYDISFVGSLYNEKDEYAELDIDKNQKSRLEKLIERQRSHPGLELLDREFTDQDMEAIKNATPGFYSSSYGVRNIDRFWAINLYMGDHLTRLDRLHVLNTLAGGLSGHPVHLFTRSDTSELGENIICHGGVNSLLEMPWIFRRSKINLNHTMRAIRTGLPQRIWDILGSGGFLLTNAQAEIPLFLQIGKHLDVYENDSELLEKTHYWLTHDEERTAIAMAGYQEVREKHTTVQRVIEMLRLMM